MAKEWDKFQADYKKLTSDIDKYASKNLDGVYQRVRLAKSNCDEGENHLTETMVTSRKNGVTGSTLADFMKDKDFAGAKTLLDSAARDLAEELKTLLTFCTEAETTMLKVGTLYKAIEKDLKSRKDKSESKKDIEKLQATALDTYKDLEKAAAFRDKPNKQTLGYIENYMKTIARIVATAPEEAQRQKTDTEIPQLFVDRNIKLNTSKALSLGKKVSDDCDAALTASEKDLRAALPHLKTAQVALLALKKIADDYAAATKKYKANLDISKDKDKIAKMLTGIDKSFDTAARKFKGVSTTIKKAG